LRLVVLFFLLASVIASIAIAQDLKPWPNWNKNEVEKILNHSPWGQTQTDTDTSEMVYSPTAAGRSSIGQSTARATSNQQAINNARADRGATNQAVSVNYHIRFLSAKPIRQAVARMIELKEKDGRKVVEQMSPFVTRDFSSFIVVAVTLDSTDSRFSGPALQVFASSTAGTLKNQTYLERKDGKRLFMIDYKPPIADGLGAKFIFPRIVDGRPFLAESGMVRFFAQMNDTIKLSTTFKLSDMIYEGKLEY
jgi:hypothetical protein